ncbi:hypothetical protein ABKV19_008488 [Rosa sericea]
MPHRRSYSVEPPPPPPPATLSEERYIPIPSATELMEVGVKFTCGNKGKQLHISFNNGEMEISPISIGKNVESLLRNLIACEKLAFQDKRTEDSIRITSYAAVMANLINSSKDVDLLKEKGIIHAGRFRSEDIAGVFSRLFSSTTGIFVSYAGLSSKVHDHYKAQWIRRRLSIIKRDYLYNPSSIWSTANAVVLVIILAIIQTIYSVLAYYK